MSDYLIDQGPEIYCHKLARIDHLGPNKRLVFTVPDLQGGQYVAVCVKLVMPAEALAALVSMASPTDPSQSSLLLTLETSSAN